MLIFSKLIIKVSQFNKICEMNYGLNDWNMAQEGTTDSKSCPFPPNTFIILRIKVLQYIG